jgi:hypothetical protein
MATISTTGATNQSQIFPQIKSLDGCNGTDRGNWYSANWLNAQFLDIQSRKRVNDEDIRVLELQFKKDEAENNALMKQIKQKKVIVLNYS